MTTDRTLVRRAGANLARGLGGSLPLALLPPLLARRLADDEFAVWILIVQLASYVIYLEFGVQTAVSKTAAAAFAEGDIAKTRGPIAAGMRLLVITAAIGSGFVAVVAALLPALFDIPHGLTGTARLALLVLGIAAAVGLPASAVHGALLGIGRNGVSAIVVVVSRLFGVGLTLVGVSLGWSLPVLALALASGSLLNGVLPFVAARRIGLPAAMAGASPIQRREILDLTATFGAFTVATLLVSGVDVVVVGVVDFEQVAAYGLGASLVTVIAAGYTVMFTVLLPAFADSAARGDRSEARQLVVRSTTLSSWALAAGFVVAFAAEGPLMRQWAGAYAGDAGPVFLLLLAAGVVRLSALPLVQYIVGVGDHRHARIPAVGEALLNLVLSIVLGAVIGARGVAIATLIGAFAALSYYLGHLAPRALGRPRAWKMATESYLLPAVLVAIAAALAQILVKA